MDRREWNRQIVDFDFLAFYEGNRWLRRESASRLEFFRLHLGGIERGVLRFHANYLPYNVKEYRKLYPKLSEDIAHGYFRSEFHHFCEYGYHDIVSGRKPWAKDRTRLHPSIKSFNYKFFIEANTDLFGEDGFDMVVLERYMEKVGFGEIARGERRFHPEFAPFSESLYLESYPKIREDVEAGYFVSGYHHFAEYGYGDILARRRYWPGA